MLTVMFNNRKEVAILFKINNSSNSSNSSNNSNNSNNREESTIETAILLGIKGTKAQAITILDLTLITSLPRI